MTDIVERLRDPATPIVMRPKPDPLRLEAAAEIERLREQLRAVLLHVADVRAQRNEQQP